MQNECKEKEKWLKKIQKTISPILGHTKCYLCDNFGHKANYYKFPYTLNKFKQNMEATPSRRNNEPNGNEDSQRQPTKVWKRKEKHEASMSS